MGGLALASELVHAGEEFKEWFKSTHYDCGPSGSGPARLREL